MSHLSEKEKAEMFMVSRLEEEQKYLLSRIEKLREEKAKAESEIASLSRVLDRKRSDFWRLKDDFYRLREKQTVEILRLLGVEDEPEDE